MLFLSLIISSVSAGLVFWSLDRIIVRPVSRLTRNMMAFEKNPEDETALLVPSKRHDEIGVAERSLAALERRTQSLLAERQRLATLGAGISKISHDLRNILASAQLMSDRLAKSEDPRVRKLSPRLISSLDRAIALSRDTLSYARMEPSALKIESVDLGKLVADVLDDSASMSVDLVNEVAQGTFIEADSTQLYRALFNLVRNAVEALEPAENGEAPPGPEGARVTIRARATDRGTIIAIADNGPGVSEDARRHLFEPFKGSYKPGGSGLGAAIAHEIVKAHGGELRLAKSDENGATFELMLPGRRPAKAAQ